MYSESLKNPPYKSMIINDQFDVSSESCEQACGGDEQG
jgi:hypothetical protein